MAKRYLDVSYDDRDLAKRLGAKWDPSVRRWYCPAGSPLAKIFKWRAEAKVAETKVAEVKSQMTANLVNTNMPASPRPMNSDIHFKASAEYNRRAQPAMNQNFELFMAS